MEEAKKDAKVEHVYDERMCKHFNTDECLAIPPPNVSQTDEDIVGPLSNLTVCEILHDELPSDSIASRSELSKVEVWYVTYGSNMYEPRFLCYIQGGKVDGMQRACFGAVDRTLPKKIKWKTVPHRVFFGRESTVTWGPGGVAFLNPESNNEESTHICLYRITLAQFNDVLIQENCLNPTTESPPVSVADLHYIVKNGTTSVERLLGGWYHTILYLGQESDIPILTMTCSESDVESFKAGELSVCPPAKEYANVLVKGLWEGKQVSKEEDAKTLIQEAANRPL